MNDLHFLPSRGEVQARYDVRLLADPQPTPEGLVHRTARGVERVPWPRVAYALAAEVGEPQGIRTIVFDLVIGREEGRWTVLRFDEEPGEDAEAFAQVLAGALRPERLGAAVKSLASESVVAEWFPDVPTFEETSLALLEKRRAAGGA
jgi:hypothetical protein